MRITVNYEELAQGAGYLHQQSEEYHQMVHQIYSRMQQMQGIWQGSDHQAFISQLEQFRPQLEKLRDVIEAYSQYLFKSASLYQQVQQDRIAKARSLA